MPLLWKIWYAWYPVKITVGPALGCWAWRTDVEWCDWSLRSAYVDTVRHREYRMPPRRARGLQWSETETSYGVEEGKS